MLLSAQPVFALSIAQIAIPADRIGFFNEPHATQLGESIRAIGQHDPIHVQRRGNAAKLPWMLVAGLHRLRGAELAGLATVNAVQIADASATADDLRRLELSENLDHRQRRPIERALFIAERARLEEAVDYPGHVGERQHERGARQRHSAAATMAAADYRDRTAEACGISLRTLERYQRLHREISEALNDRALVQRLNDHPLGESMTAMLRIGQLTKADAVAARIGIDPYAARRALVQVIVDHPGIASVDEAFAVWTDGARKGARSPAADPSARVARHWERMPLPDQRAFAVQLADSVSDQIAADMIASFKKRGLIG